MQFENLTYRGENLEGYGGESVVLRFDPRNITTVLVYALEKDREVFLARAYATDLETKQISLDESKAMSRKIREVGKTLSNRSILEELRDRDTFVIQKKSRKERQKEASAELKAVKQPLPVELKVSDVHSTAEDKIESQLEPEMPELFDYQQLREDYGW